MEVLTVEQYVARQQAKQARAVVAGKATPATHVASSPATSNLSRASGTGMAAYHNEPMSFTPGLPVEELESGGRQQQLSAALEGVLPAESSVATSSMSSTLTCGALVALTTEAAAEDRLAVHQALGQHAPEVVMPAFGQAQVATAASGTGPAADPAGLAVGATRSALLSASEGGHAAVALTLAIPAGASEDSVLAVLHQAVPGEFTLLLPLPWTADLAKWS